MQAFAQLLDALSTAFERNAKLRMLADYFTTTPDPDRGFALAALTESLDVKFPMRRVLAELIEKRTDPVLYKISRDFVGDTAETTALIWQANPANGLPPEALSLKAIHENFVGLKPSQMAPVLEAYLDSLDITGRWALLKFLGGALRVGVSARLAKMGLAQAFGRDLAEMEEIWHALKPPYHELFQWAEGLAPLPDFAGVPRFRPLMLAHPIEENDWADLTPENLIAEWKWDGIRVQISATGNETRIFSRQAEDISSTFPEIIEAFHGQNAVLDGELLIARDGQIAPFSDLQQRLNRKTVSAKMRTNYPAFIRLYDILLDAEDDLRGQPLRTRRQRLEVWFQRQNPALSDLSPIIDFNNIAELRELWAKTRISAIEGLMLKRADSPYLQGRPKGHWFKWKRQALTIDCVLMYAERGAGKRSSLYSDYTFGCWDEHGALLPVGKAYSGFTDDELKKLDAFIRENTTERFGPVRAVKPGLVLEVAFDAVNRSTRHKSGLAMRFPRIHRIRWDKPAHEADQVSSLLALVEKS